MKASLSVSDQALESLHQFFGANFHQDWTLEASCPAEIIQAFKQYGIESTELAALADNIESYAASKPDDETAEKDLLVELGCYYSPGADGIEAKTWLHQVACLLRE